MAVDEERRSNTKGLIFVNLNSTGLETMKIDRLVH